jgi:hypothetical protein
MSILRSKLYKLELLQKLNIWTIHVLIPIIVGGFLYISFRSENLLMFQWVKSIRLTDEISSIRNFTLQGRYWIPKWIYFSLPDALWVYAFSSALILIWKPKSFKILLLTLSIPCILGSGIEILQLFTLFKGTFDTLDLFLCLLAQFLCILFYKLNRKKYFIIKT